MKKKKIIIIIIIKIKRSIKTADVTKGPAFSTKVEKLLVDLDPALIASGNWKDRAFKKYNFATQGADPAAGHLHPLLKVREEFRHIFLEMG